MKPKALLIGPLSKNGRGAHASLKAPTFDIPARITNANSRHPYVPPKWDVRQGADDHQQCLSVGDSV